MKGKAQVTRERERERERKVRRRKDSRVAAPFISFMWVPPIL